MKENLLINLETKLLNIYILFEFFKQKMKLNNIW